MNNIKFFQKSRRISSALVKKRAGEWLFSLVRLAFLIGASYIILYPLFLKISISIMSYGDMTDMTVKWIPKNPSLDNFKTVLEKIDYFEYFFTTLGLSLLTTLLQMFSCVTAGYAFGRFKFKGRGILFFIVILMLVVPPQTYITSSYLQFRCFDFFGIGELFGIPVFSLINTPVPMILMSIGCMGIKNGLLIYILRQFFQNLPKEIEEAAWVDGAGTFSIFRRVMLPNAVPALTTVFVFSFVWAWNDLYNASTYMPNMTLFPLAVNNITFSIQQAFGGLAQINPVEVSLLTNAVVLLILLPLLAFFLITQRFFIEGLERTGITG